MTWVRLTHEMIAGTYVIDELSGEIRAWMWENGIRPVLWRSMWTVESSPGFIIRFYAGFENPDDAFAFRMRWC